LRGEIRPGKLGKMQKEEQGREKEHVLLRTTKKHSPPSKLTAQNENDTKKGAFQRTEKEDNCNRLSTLKMGKHLKDWAQLLHLPGNPGGAGKKRILVDRISKTNRKFRKRK